MTTRIVLVFIAGGIGSIARYLISLSAANWMVSSHVRLGTMICNVLGCLLIGLFHGLSTRFGWNDEVRLALTIGLCGGFTTFSTFSNEGIAYLQSAQYTSYAIYTLSSIILGLLAVFVGAYITR